MSNDNRPIIGHFERKSGYTITRLVLVAFSRIKGASLGRLTHMTTRVEGPFLGE